MIQRFTLDAPSFEQVLSALSLVQQLKKQIPQAFVSDPDEGPLSELVEAQQAIETETVDLDTALERVVSLALQLTPAIGAAVWFFTEHDFVCRAATTAAAGDERLRLEVLARLAVSDVPDLSEEISPGRSLLVAPIHQGRNIAGALAVFSPVPNAFSERDDTRVRLLSGLVAHALRKTADAELRQIVSLERAAMLEAMDQIMPALRKLAEDEGGHGAASLTAAVALGPATELPSGPTVLPDFLAEVIAPEPGLGRAERTIPAARETAAAEERATTGDAGGQPNVFLLLQQETEREANEPAVMEVPKSPVSTAVPAVDAAEVPIQRVRPVRVKVRLTHQAMDKAFSGTVAGWAILAGRAAKRGAAWGEAGMWWASRQLEDVGSVVMEAGKSLEAHWQSVARRRPEAAIWMRHAIPRLSSSIAWANKKLWHSGAPAVPAAGKRPGGAAPGKALCGEPMVGEGKAGGRKQKRRGHVAGRTAGSALLLLIVAASWILMRSTGVPSHVAAPGTTPIAGGSANLRASARAAETAPGTVAVKSSSTPSLTVATFPVAAGGAKVTPPDRARVGEGGTFALSHLQVTDQGTASKLASLSQFEIAGLRRQGQYGDDGAEFLLGMAYETGRGVPQSCAKAGEWVTRSAEAGNAAAQYNLGLRYREGDGVAADPKLAEKWLKRAAKRKYAAAVAQVAGHGSGEGRW